jgi:beta-fructofuranosidase
MILSACAPKVAATPEATTAPTAGSSVGVDRQALTAPLTLEPDRQLKVDVYVDGSVIEVFAGGNICLTSRVYPASPDSTYINLYTLSDRARLKSLDIWTFRSIWAGSKI